MTFPGYCLPLEEFIKTIGNIIDYPDVDTRDHSKNTASIAKIIASGCNLSEEEVEFVGYGGFIHDLGKLALDANVLRQPTKLTRAQYHMVQQHIHYGLAMLRDAQLPKIIMECVEYHHEHWDGSGYPKGISGNSIPMSGMIVCMADVWESINSDRPYRKAYKRNDAIVFMGTRKGTWFDPYVYGVFVDLLRSDAL